MPLPKDSALRKTYPLFRGLFGYFPDALAEVAHHSWAANEKHNPGEPIHWSREKSTDHKDCILRHVLDSEIEIKDSEGLYHLAGAAWRSLAALQEALEAERKTFELQESNYFQDPAGI